MATLGFRQLFRGLDLGLLTSVLLLAIIGLAALYSFAVNVDHPDFTIFYKQVAFLVVGLAMALVAMRLDYRWLAGVHWLLYGLGVASLLAVLVVGKTIRGSTGWFQVGGFQLEPVEFVKIIMAVVLARYFADHADRINSWRLILISGAITLLPVGLVVAQPDIGSAIVLLGMWVGFLIALPVSRRKILLVGLVGVVMAVGSWFTLLHPYQKNRILNFISPTRDPLSSGYNVQQAITALGSGGWFGRGLGLGTQSQLNFLPERHTDFIFASIGEELGLVGGLVIVALFALLFWRMYHVVRSCRDSFSGLFVLAILFMLFIQVAVNIGMNMGVFPVTGITLPFISYGGSSLIASLLAVGLLESLAIRQRIVPV